MAPLRVKKLFMLTDVFGTKLRWSLSKIVHIGLGVLRIWTILKKWNCYWPTRWFTLTWSRSSPTFKVTVVGQSSESQEETRNARAQEGPQWLSEGNKHIVYKSISEFKTVVFVFFAVTVYKCDIEIKATYLTDLCNIWSTKCCWSSRCDLERGHSSFGNYSELLLACLIGQYGFTRWCLSSVVVCNAAGGPAAGAWAVGRPTLHGGPVRLRPVRATPCCKTDDTC